MLHTMNLHLVCGRITEMNNNNYVGLKKVARKKRWKSFFILVLVSALSAGATFLFFKMQDDGSATLSSVSTTSATTTIPSTTTTQPEDAVAHVALIAEDNDSDATMARLIGDFEGQVNVTQVGVSVPITQTVIVVGNTLFDVLATQIATTLNATLGQAPGGQLGQLESDADIVVYVAN